MGKVMRKTAQNICFHPKSCVNCAFPSVITGSRFPLICHGLFDRAVALQRLASHSRGLSCSSPASVMFLSPAEARDHTTLDPPPATRIS